MSQRTRLWAPVLGAALLGSLIPAAVSEAQDVPLSWQALQGPPGQISLVAAAPDGSAAYAVSVVHAHRAADQTLWRDTGGAMRSDALYQSTDQGNSWRAATNSLPPSVIHDITVHPTTGQVYALLGGGGANGGVWRSGDRGVTWERLLPERTDVRSGRLAFSGAGRYLFVTENAGDDTTAIWRTSDGGRTWENLALPSGFVPAALSTRTQGDGELLVASTGGVVVRSSDGGGSWGAADATGGSSLVMAFGKDRPETVLMALNEGADARLLGLRRSRDGGQSWTPLTASGLPAEGLPGPLTSLGENTFLLTVGSTTYRSTDNGATWRAAEGPLGATPVARFAVLAGRQTAILAATGAGIYLSRDRGALWQRAGAGLPVNGALATLLTSPAFPRRIIGVPDTLQVAGAAPFPPLLRSLDGGDRWEPAGLSLSGRPVTASGALPEDPGRLYLVQDGAVALSADAGLTWETRPLPAGERTGLAIAPSAPTTLYLSGSPALRSTDGGLRWSEMPVQIGDVAVGVTALVVDPADARHLWVALGSVGIAESTDGGRAWQPAGLAGKPARWLAVAIISGRRVLVAGVTGEGVFRRDAASGEWTPVATGLPEATTPLAFLADPRPGGAWWLARDGGGVYRSTDGGASWSNASTGMGDNLVLALALDYDSGGILASTATGGLWALRPHLLDSADGAQPASATAVGVTHAALDGRIEIVWPHDGAAVSEARLANVGVRLFLAGSLVPPACSWSPRVIVWQAVDNAPAQPLRRAVQRSVDGQPFPYWELNDVAVDRANDARHTLFFLVEVEGVDTATSVWAHGADARTSLPLQDTPSGLAEGAISAVDARIQVVWPHDGTGEVRPVTDATLANVAVAFFKHGTRLSVPAGWQPKGISLYGAWNGEVGRVIAGQARPQLRTAGAVTYPVWEFNNVPVARAADPLYKLYLWVKVDGLDTYPSIWAHGADARTYFPAVDEPVQGCRP